ncbi:MAG: hypothetical protein ACI4HI_02465 [Lachnospiraceae bacterium]
MHSTIGSMIFAVTAWGSLASGAFVIRKSEKKQNIVTWAALILVLITCFHVAAAALMQLIHIPINILSMGMLDLLAGFFFWYQILKKKKEKQQYAIEWVDILMLFVFAACAVFVFVVRYHGTSLRLTFETIDPAAHLKAAMDVIQRQKVNGMYYSAMENGLFIETFAPLVRLDFSYKLFNLTEIYHLILSGMVFYAAVRSIATDRFLKWCTMILSVVYMFGYPLLSMIYGFVYLGLGVTVVCTVLILADFLLKQEMDSRNWNILLLSMACFGIFQCYVLFMPMTYFAVITGIFVMQQKKRQLISKETVAICLETFLLPCIFGFLYTYAGIFTSQNLTVANQIVAEGACYRDLYSNFLPFLPLALFGWLKLFQKKENCVEKYMFVYTILFIGGLFLMGMQKKASSYYYYKNYHLLWLMVFFLLMHGIACVEKKSRSLVGCYGFVTAGLVLVLFTNLEAKIQLRVELFDPVNKSVALNDLWSFQRGKFNAPGYSEEKQELYHYVYEHCLEENPKKVGVVAKWEDVLWYEAITNQRLKGCKYDKPRSKKNLKWIKKNAQYVLVLKDSEMYRHKKSYYEALPRVYENQEGYLAQIQK